MTEMSILSIIYSNGGCMEFIALLNFGLYQSDSNGFAIKEHVQILLKKGYLCGQCRAGSTLHITQAGIVQLNYHTKVVEQVAQ